MKSQKKNKLRYIVNNVKLLKPKQKLVVMKAMQDEKPLTEKDIKIMEWSLDIMKEAKKNNELLQGGLKILNKAIERQNKKS